MYHKFLAFALFVFIAACASTPPPPAVSPKVVEKEFFALSPSDGDVFNKGLSYLGDHEKAADYAKARETFDELLTKYPGSKWRKISETMIRVIDAHRSSEEAYRAEKTKLLREVDQLKKENRRLLEETVKLVQENEQLKKDIQLLKSLEVQLERREKMLK